ncbi:hypothetical protein FOA52_001228 [Chlamydomonas sp. UWO 241]|nr:hypothetical protein FOA52_001228 [Chlamydomonas sp. UWO 241]
MVRLKGLFLPEGYPDSVSSDYLDYQLWSVPTHITGWLSHSLTTSSLLQAVGLAAGPAGTVGLAAAVKWIAKDGIGAAGRLLVGGRLGLELDDDPRRWRMFAEVVTTLGLMLEALTSVYPSNFLLLACTGNFATAVGKGIGRPAFRVVQTHFAAANNVGAVAAKEEVWEVVGQLSGLLASITLLQVLESTGSSQYVVAAWALSQGTHVLLRRHALSKLRFTTLSRKRAGALARAHVAGSPLPSVRAANAEEPLWEGPDQVRPYMTLGCGLEELLEGWRADGGAHGSDTHSDNDRAAAGQSGDARPSTSGRSSGGDDGGSGGGEDAAGWTALGPRLSRFAALYAGEGYMLAWGGARGGGARRARVVLKAGAGPGAPLRAIWQAAWLEHAAEQRATHLTGTDHNGEQLGLLADSLDALRVRYGEFEGEARGLGWDLRVNLKCGNGRVSAG